MSRGEWMIMFWIGFFCGLWAVPAWVFAHWLGARGDHLLLVTVQAPVFVLLLLWALAIFTGPRADQPQDGVNPGPPAGCPG